MNTPFYILIKMREHNSHDHTHGDHGHEEHEVNWVFLGIILATTIIVAYMLDLFFNGIPLGFTVPIIDEEGVVSDLIYHVVVTPIGLYIGYLGFERLIREKTFTTESLMGIASLSALYLDYIFEAATILLLFSFAEYFEHYIEDRARKTVEKLVKYIPEKARVIRGNKEELIDIKKVMPGMEILIKPGERIPLDGVVIGGESYVDESIVTGESMPVFKKTGDEVYGSTLNVNGILKVRVTKLPEETLVSKIVKLVLEARSKKAKIENLVDRFSRYYVPAIIIAAVITAVVPPLFMGEPIRTWIYRALIVLVIACPSAFIISVPATFFSAITLSARKGIIIKGGVYIEKMAEIKTAIFDKTGTLTLGSPSILTDCRNSYFQDKEVLAYAAALERYSNHPIAKAIVRMAEKEDINFRDMKVANVREIPGKGIIGVVNGRTVMVGGVEMLEDRKGLNVKELVSDDTHTKVFVIMEKSLAARLCLADRVREDAVEAIKRLKEMGIYTVILTGDKEDVAREIARELGVDEYYAELLPEEKLELVSRFQSKNGPVAMIGDGINDAPALAASDVGIAMSDVGADVALESADMVLVKNRLTQIPYIYKLSKKTVEIARQNIAISLGTKLLLGALGVMGFIPLWFTVAVGDDGITLFLLLNILRLARVK